MTSSYSSNFSKSTHPLSVAIASISIPHNFMSTLHFPNLFSNKEDLSIALDDVISQIKTLYKLNGEKKLKGIEETVAFKSFTFCYV